MDATVERSRPLTPCTQRPTLTSVHPSGAARVLPRTAVRHDAVPALGGTVAASAAGYSPRLLLVVAVTPDAGVDIERPPRRRRRPAPRGHGPGDVPPCASPWRREAAASTLSQPAGGATAGAAARGGEGGGGLAAEVRSAFGGRPRRLCQFAGRERRRPPRQAAARGRAARSGGGGGGAATKWGHLPCPTSAVVPKVTFWFLIGDTMATQYNTVSPESRAGKLNVSQTVAPREHFSGG